MKAETKKVGRDCMLLQPAPGGRTAVRPYKITMDAFIDTIGRISTSKAEYFSEFGRNKNPTPYTLHPTPYIQM